MTAAAVICESTTRFLTTHEFSATTDEQMNSITRIKAGEMARTILWMQHTWMQRTGGPRSVVRSNVEKVARELLNWHSRIQTNRSRVVAALGFGTRLPGDVVQHISDFATSRVCPSLVEVIITGLNEAYRSFIRGINWDDPVINSGSAYERESQICRDLFHIAHVGPLELLLEYVDVAPVRE